jgi:segregation and condensation protein A
MDGFEFVFKHEKFQGPLDVLLHLISKHKLNIEDIEIAGLLEQYLLFLSCSFEDDGGWNVSHSMSEFLEMAARLIYIKTQALLPKPEAEEDGPELLKLELQKRLMEYARYKELAKLLNASYTGDNIFTRMTVQIPEMPVSAYTRKHSPEKLRTAYLNVGKRSQPAAVSEKIDTIMKCKIVPVTTKVVSVLRKLYKNAAVEMTELYEEITDRSEKVAMFLAVLELVKSGRILIEGQRLTMRTSLNK